MATPKKDEKRKITLNLDNMTLGDMEDFEDATGKTVEELLGSEPVLDENGRKVADPDDPKGRPLMKTKVSMRAMVGLIYISLKKDNPSITPADVRAMPINDFEFEEDPTEAAE